MTISTKCLLLYLFAACISVVLGVNGPCNTYERLVLNEGKKKCVYLDSLGIPTVGIGFNLERSDARSRLTAVGANYNAVLKGSVCLTDQQIKQLFNQDMSDAVSCASSWLPNWNMIDTSPQSALADMAFNLGCPRLRQFRRLRAALSRNPPNYQDAAKEMRNSRWCRQVKSRCDRDVQCMQQGSSNSGGGWWMRFF